MILNYPQYMSFTFSDLNLSRLLNKQSFTPLFVAKVANLNEDYVVRSFPLFTPISMSASSKSTLVL